MQSKVKIIVTFFKSPQATTKLNEIQKQMGFVKLTMKQDTITCSTHAMFTRIWKLKELKDISPYKL